MAEVKIWTEYMSDYGTVKLHILHQTCRRSAVKSVHSPCTVVKILNILRTVKLFSFFCYIT